MNVLTEKITKTVMSAFGHEHSQVSGFTNQLSNERQISPVVAYINNITPYTSEASSFGWDQ